MWQGIAPLSLGGKYLCQRDKHFWYEDKERPSVYKTKYAFGLKVGCVPLSFQKKFGDKPVFQVMSGISYQSKGYLNLARKEDGSTIVDLEQEKKQGLIAVSATQLKALSTFFGSHPEKELTHWEID